MAEPLSGAAIAGIVTVAVGVVQGGFELVKYMVGVIASKDDESCQGGMTRDEHAALFLIRDEIKSLADMHDKYDQDGTPLWYVPRSWAETQKVTLEVVKEVATTQKQTVDMLQRLASTIDRIDRRHNEDVDR